MSDLETHVLALLLSWLGYRHKNRLTETGVSWVFDNGLVGDVPEGWNAVVSVELRRVGETEDPMPDRSADA